MTSQKQSKGALHSLFESLKGNNHLVALGLASMFLGGIAFYQISMRRANPDFKKIEILKQIIDNSATKAEQSLKTLQIEKKIMTQFVGKDPQQPQINMIFYLMTKLKLKQKNKFEQVRNPFLPPFEQGLFITQLEPSHRLLYNKFNIFKNHLLVITKQYQEQQKGPNAQDFKQIMYVVKSLKGLFFYNCGQFSGASQPHKHAQIFPQQAKNQLPIVKDIQKYIEMLKNDNKKFKSLKGKIIQFPGFTFTHGLIMVQDSYNLSILKKDLYQAYTTLYEKLFSDNPKPLERSFNLIGSDEFIMMIPRKKQKAFDQISVNSVGFMGSILFKQEAQLSKYINLGIKPIQILEDITFKKGVKY